MQLVSVPLDGVPRTGVVSVGEVSVLFVNVSVLDVVTMFTPSIAATPAEIREIVVSVALPNSIDPTPNANDVDAVRPEIGSPVQFVRDPEDGVPRTGVFNTGLFRVLLLNVSVVDFATSVSFPNGSVNVDDANAPVGGVNVIVPDVAFLKSTVPTVAPA